MESNQIITYILGVVIVGYGTYMFFRSIKRQVKGDCSVCSYSCNKNCNCSSNTKK